MANPYPGPEEDWQPGDAPREPIGAQGRPLITAPLSSRGWPVWLVYALAVAGVIYVLNPTAGILEFLPDNFPIIGNLDEGVAYLLIWAGVLEFLEGRKRRPPEA